MRTLCYALAATAMIAVAAGMSETQGPSADAESAAVSVATVAMGD